MGIEEIKQHDIVISNDQFCEIPKGSKGTIIHVYEALSMAEVEFIVNKQPVITAIPLRLLILKENV